MSSKLKPTLWLRDISQRIPCFDRCQLTITWMSKIKEVRYKLRLHVCHPISWSEVAILGDSAAVVVVVMRTHLQAIPLAIISTRKSIYGFPLLSYMGMVVRLTALRVAGAPL